MADGPRPVVRAIVNLKAFSLLSKMKGFPAICSAAFSPSYRTEKAPQKQTNNQYIYKYNIQ